MLDPISLAHTLGYLGIGTVIFTETGLLVGLMLPGDSLLFSAGFIASLGYLNIVPLCIIAFLAAAAGDSVGYALGKKYGPKIFTQEHSFFFDKQHIARAQAFYQKHGGKTIVLARFMPIIRTVAPVLAGVGTMRYSTFLSYNILGALLWTCGVTLMGYFLGYALPHADTYVLPIVGLIVFVSILPSAIPIAKRYLSKKQK